MTALLLKKSKDRKKKKLTAAQAQEAFERKFTAYMEERLLNVIQQIRATNIAAKISPEDFWKAFSDDKAQDDFYIRLHAQEDFHNAGVEQEVAKQEAQNEVLKQSGTYEETLEKPDGDEPA